MKIWSTSRKSKVCGLRPTVSIPRSAFRNSHSQGFTLLEMLVVVSILMVLAGMILAGLSAAQSRAKGLRASREVKQLKTAWDTYYADYSGFPEDASGNAFPVTESDIACIQILRGIPHADDSAAVAQYRSMNPKKIPYMDFHHKTTTFNDPWGNPYRIALDADYDGEVTIPGGTLRQSVAVWSNGPDGVPGNKDDLKSWR